ncbi:hypothetical protein M407DRAFT_25548 [Tulasnella calospora MUT 4182]|uniref:F-box domain-containing protein n=1 Tax=Tulasnella calospora MUT 4182 TaxID=1051891 RepID=A0A0C3Q6R2_9AGAM|nr:hypothetical protein M407DRAFT_25548 [Tulasnella calospora MUT 4182]
MEIAGSRQTFPQSSISRLPPELLVAILKFELQSNYFMAESTIPTTDFYLRLYMRRLYTMRLVGKRWQEIIDGTPTFWIFVLASLPPHVNDTTILRSKTRPFSVVYAPGTEGKQPPVKDFLAMIAHTHSRWSAYTGPAVPEYLDAMGPLLQEINLWTGFEEQFPAKPWELLGGSTTGLRHVALYGVSIRWRMGMFFRLKSLTLNDVKRRWNGFKTGYILDFLHASPCLEHLRLESLHTTITIEDAPPSIITLPRLRSIRLYDCQDLVTEPILQHIRAPSCINFSLSVPKADSPEGAHRLMEEVLLPFQGIIRTIHECHGDSEIGLGFSEFSWHTPRLSDKDHQFNVSLSGAALMIAMRWVEEILGPNSSLSLHFPICFNDAILEIIAPTRCVTKVVITPSRGREDFLRILSFLARRLLVNPSLPALPRLREIILTSSEWTAQDILSFVCSRCNPPSLETAEQPLLVITMRRRWVPFRNGPQPVLDYAVLTKIREHKSVERVEFVGLKARDGMLAVIWNEELSQPQWC